MTNNLIIPSIIVSVGIVVSVLLIIFNSQKQQQQQAQFEQQQRDGYLACLKEAELKQASDTLRLNQECKKAGGNSSECLEVMELADEAYGKSVRNCEIKFGE